MYNCRTAGARFSGEVLHYRLPLQARERTHVSTRNDGVDVRHPFIIWEGKQLFYNYCLSRPMQKRRRRCTDDGGWNCENGAAMSWPPAPSRIA